MKAHSSCSEPGLLGATGLFLVELRDHVTSELGAEGSLRRLASKRLGLTGLFLTTMLLHEVFLLDVGSDGVLKLGDLVEKRRDDVLSKVIGLLLLAEPSEVLILQLQVVELLVKAV